MKNIIENLDKVFDSRIRLGVMSVIVVSDSVDFNTLKEKLDVTDGNLASHISALEKNKYIKIKKRIIGKKMNTTYTVTESGRKAFANHLNALEQLLKSNSF